MNFCWELDQHTSPCPHFPPLSFCWSPVIPADHPPGQGTFKMARAGHPCCSWYSAAPDGLSVGVPPLSTALALQPWAAPGSLLSLEFSRKEAGMVLSAHLHLHTPGNTYIMSPRKSPTRDGSADCMGHTTCNQETQCPSLAGTPSSEGVSWHHFTWFEGLLSALPMRR